MVTSVSESFTHDVAPHGADLWYVRLPLAAATKLRLETSTTTGASPRLTMVSAWVVPISAWPMISLAGLICSANDVGSSL